MDNEYNYYNPDKDCRSGGSGGSQPERGPVKKKHKGAAIVAGDAGLAILFGGRELCGARRRVGLFLPLAYRKKG